MSIRKIVSFNISLNNMVFCPLRSGPLTSHLIVGRSGSGKSNLLVNLLKNKHFYGDWYDSVILISPTADTDDIQKQLGVKEDLTFSDLKEAPAIIHKIFELQREKVKQLGADKAPKLCIIMDDVMSSPDFVKSPAFLSCFIKARHYNCGIFCCVQALRAKQVHTQTHTHKYTQIHTGRVSESSPFKLF